MCRLLIIWVRDRGEQLVHKRKLQPARRATVATVEVTGAHVDAVVMLLRLLSSNVGEDVARLAASTASSTSTSTSGDISLSNITTASTSTWSPTGTVATVDVAGAHNVQVHAPVVHVHVANGTYICPYTSPQGDLRPPEGYLYNYIYIWSRDRGCLNLTARATLKQSLNAPPQTCEEVLLTALKAQQLQEGWS